jgi:outer membrane lipoprotein SlyB
LVRKEEWRRAPKMTNVQDMIKKAIDAYQHYKMPVYDPAWPTGSGANEGGTINLKQVKAIGKAMEAAATHNALNNVRIGLHGSRLDDLEKRVKMNPRVSDEDKASFQNPFIDEKAKNKYFPKEQFHTQELGDAYWSTPDEVWLPSGNPGVLMHELGHATDFNEYDPEDKVRSALAGLYQRFAPTLWMEHAAWNKGKDRLLSGAAKTKLDPDLLVKTLEQSARTKPMGLGSYWGHSLGGALGTVGGGILGAMKGSPAGPLGYGILGALTGNVVGKGIGTPLGYSIGSALGSRKSLGDEKALQSYLDEYADAYSKEYNIPKELALTKLTRLRDAIREKEKAKKKKPKAKKPMAKAADTLNKETIMSNNRYLNAAKFGANLAKTAAFRDLGSVARGTGPQQMSNALSMFHQARALVDPTDTLESAGLSRGTFNDMIKQLADKKDEGYEFSEMKRSPKAESIIKGLVGAAAGGVAGKYTGQGLGKSLGLAAMGGLTGAGMGHLGASRYNRNLLATAKVLKEYGLLKPEYLREALPLLHSDEEKPWYEKALGTIGI